MEAIQSPLLGDSCEIGSIGARSKIRFALIRSGLKLYSGVMYISFSCTRVYLTEGCCLGVFSLLTCAWETAIIDKLREVFFVIGGLYFFTVILIFSFNHNCTSIYLQ